MSCDVNTNVDNGPLIPQEILLTFWYLGIAIRMLQRSFSKKHSEDKVFEQYN